MTDFNFLGSKVTADGDCSHEMLAPWKRSYDQPRQHIKKQRCYFASKGPSIKAMVFPVVMYVCESWTIKKASTEELMFLNYGLEKTLESPLDCKVIQPVNPKGNQSSTLIERTDAEGATPILWPPDGLIGKYPDAGKD